MKSSDVVFLSQLTSSLADAGEQLEKAGIKEDYEAFNKTKKIMLMIQKEISELTK
jgi:hypothetical protein